MKWKADGLPMAVGVVAMAAALFLPVRAVEMSLPLADLLKPAKVGALLGWFLAAAAFWGFRTRFWQDDASDSRRLRRGVLLLVLQAVLLRAVLELTAQYGPWPWGWLPDLAWVWVPWFLIPAVAGLLLGWRFGVFTCLGATLMLYLVNDPGPWPLIGCMTAGLAGLLCLRRSPTRGRVLRAGTATGGTLGVVAIVQYALQGAPVDALAAAVLVPLAIGLFSAFFLLAFLPVIEWMLGELSDVSLIEYGTDHKLLDQLRTEAPGTWHHSLNVADLAEKAAAAIGARALFCKTAALYHDIGKLKQPAYFAENNDGPSPHEELAPEVSAQKIIEHVTHGLELGRKHRLPRAFRDIIAEHHGVSAVRYFYAKACQPLADGSRPNVDRALFSYPGPPPSTRESGIIALADAVEAASRSFLSRAETELRTFVARLLADRVSEGELAQCPLTLSELSKVEAAFVTWLKGRNHYRPAYPGMASPGPEPSGAPARQGSRPVGAPAKF